MPKGSNQKLKLIYLIKILTRCTDDKHSITMPEILSKLRSTEYLPREGAYMMI